MLAFARLRVSSLDYGLLIVERHKAPREPFTICRKTPEVWDPAHFEESFTWETDRRNPDFGVEAVETATARRTGNQARGRTFARQWRRLGTEPIPHHSEGPIRRQN